MKKTLISFVLLLTMLRCYAPMGIVTLNIPESEPLHLFNMKDPVLRVFAFYESRFDPDVINYSEDAGGLLQIRQTMINEVNDICFELGLDEFYVLSDRLDPVKAIRIWYIVQNYHNPTYDLKIACLVWNGRGKDGKGSSKYYNDISNLLSIQL